MSDALPVVVIGAGPVGLAAAAHLHARKLPILVLEAGSSAGAAMRRWGHVRMFSPWRFNVDGAARGLLERHGWVMPDGDAYPTGAELASRYLGPLAATPELAPVVRYDARVIGVSRVDHDRMKDGTRYASPYLVRVQGAEGEEDIRARAVVDASGTLDRPGVLGASGLPAMGERAAADRVFYGIPDVLGRDRARYAGRRVLVVGSGHSALNALLDLATLAAAEPTTTIRWAVRRPALGAALGGARNDQLAARGELGTRVRSLLDSRRIELVSGFRIDRITVTEGGVLVSAGERTLPPVDEVVAATGFRPDWSILSELRLEIDAVVESSRALAPLIDPNVHSCGSVPPHGAEELKHPDPDVYAIGMKSYGRAPTFLLLTGYEQARSVASAIAGDWEAARRVELTLPETGVCSTDRSATEPAASGCCAAPEPVAVALAGVGSSSAPAAGGCC